MEDRIMDAGETLSEVFDDEIALGEDLYNLVTGKPVHANAERIAHHAATIATTVIPVGKLFKAAKLTGKAVGPAIKAAVTRTDDAKDAAKAAKAAAAESRQSYRKTRNIAHTVRDVNNLTYAATGDQDALRDLSHNLRSIAKHAPLVLADYVALTNATGSARGAAQEVMKMAKKGGSLAQAKKFVQKAAKNPNVRSAAKSAVKQGTKALKKRKDEPMTLDDIQVVGQNAMYGALSSIAKGAGKKKNLFNHPSWYTKLGTDLVNLNFGAPDGVGPRPKIISQGGKTLCLTTDAIIEVMLTIPSTAANPFAVAAARIGNELRLHSGTNTIYSPVDVMAYLIEARSFMAQLCQYRRLVATLNNVDPYDVDLPEKLGLMAMGADTSTRAAEFMKFKSAAASYVTRINSLTKTLAALIPVNIALMQRTEWMFTNVFVDGKEAKNSMKIIIASTVPTAYINANGDIEVSQRAILPKYATNDDFETLFKEFEVRVSKFVSDRINMAIAGDMMKAYGSGAFWSPGVITGAEAVPVLYDEEALNQIQNCTPMLFWPIQDSGVLPYMQLIKSTGELENHFPWSSGGATAFSAETTFGAFSDRIITTFKSKPTPGEVLEMTRFNAYAKLIPNSGTTAVGNPTFETAYATDVTCGTEIVLNYTYVVSKILGSNGAYLNLIQTNLTLATDTRLVACMWAMDDWAPAIMIGTSPVVNPDGTTATVIDQLLDLSNWAKLDLANLDAFHFIAVNSLLVVDAKVQPTS